MGSHRLYQRIQKQPATAAVRHLDDSVGVVEAVEVQRAPDFNRDGLVHRAGGLGALRALVVGALVLVGNVLVDAVFVRDGAIDVDAADLYDAATS